MALQTAISEFDHDQDYKHDEELDLHADKILFQKLAFAFHVDRSSEEIAMICTALEMVYRASRPRVALSFAELRESVLPIFVEMLGKPLHLRKQEELDVALMEQEDRRIAAQDLSYRTASGGDAASNRSGNSFSRRSDQSSVQKSQKSARSQSTDDMSLQSAGKDDRTYQSYQGVHKPQKPQPDEQSYLSYDEQSLQKPKKQFDDDQSYQTYDQSQKFKKGYDDEQSYADQSYNKGNYQPAQSVKKASGEGYDDQSYADQSYNKGNYQPAQSGKKASDEGYDDQSYADQSYADQSYNKGNYQPAQSGKKASDEGYDDQSYADQSYADQSYNKGNYQPAQSGKKSSDDQTYQSYDQSRQPDDRTYQSYDQSRRSYDQSLSKGPSDYDEQSLKSYDSRVRKEDPRSYEDGTYAEGQSYADEGTYQDGQSQAEQTYDEGTYQDGQTYDGTYQEGQSQAKQTYDDDTYQNGQSQDEQTYDEGTYNDGEQGTYDEGGKYNDGMIMEERTRDDMTYDEQNTVLTEDRSVAQETQYTRDDMTYDEQNTVLTEDRSVAQETQYTRDDMTYDEQNTVFTEDRSVAQETQYTRDDMTYDDQNTVFTEDRSVAQETQYTRDDMTYDDQNTVFTEDRSVAQETQYTEGDYHSEEQSLQPTIYTNDQGDFDDAESKAGQSYYTNSEPSLQAAKYAKHIYDKNRALDDDQSYQVSQGGEEATQYTQDQSYRGDEGTYQDDMSQFTEDYTVQKPGKETYEVETVRSQEDDDEQSRDHSLISKPSGKGSGFNANAEKPYNADVTSRSGLSTVAEESQDDSSSGYSQQGSTPKPKASMNSQHSQPSKSSASSQSLLSTVNENGIMRSNRSVDSSSSAARAIKERKIENERHISEQVTRLEADLEMIRVEDTTNPVGVSRTLQVLRYFSRVLSAMIPMAHHPGLLDALVYQLERQPYGRHADHFNEYDDGEPRTVADKEELAAARVDAIATIVNLACAEENKGRMASHSGLLDAITTVAQSDPSEEAREHAAIVLMNLAYEDENKEMMVQHPHMLETLVKLIQDNSPFTRRYASAAMFTLACVVGNTERMAVFCDGEILECLRRVLADDPVDEARINAAEALFNMARNNTEETLQTMGEHPRLLATLAKAVLTDYSADVRVFCARALEWMSAGIHFPMDCHRLLLSALTVSAQWTKTSCIAEAMKTQATLAENRLPMAAHDGLLQALSNLALLESLTDTDVRKSAIAALEMISRAEKARQDMVKNEQVMRALTKASFEHGDDEVYGEDDEGTAVTTKLLKQALKNLSGEM